MKTIIYVDGYNLFYGCLKNSPYKWLDLYKLFAQQILYAQDPLANVLQIKYFTANIKAKIARNGKLAEQAQHAYHRALAKLYPSYIQIIKGSYSLERARLPLFRNPPRQKSKCRSVEARGEGNRCEYCAYFLPRRCQRGGRGGRFCFQ